MNLSTQATSGQGAPARVGPAPTRRILLIEDNDDHAELATFYLSEHADGLEVLRLADGDAAMRHLAEVARGIEPIPWLILLDLKLPRYDGHEILAHLKQTSQLSRIPVVVFTTSNASADIARALDNHANSYITKPIEPNRYGPLMAGVLDYWLNNQHGLVAQKVLTEG